MDARTTAPAAAVVLAGGRGRRLGGMDKPALLIGGRTLLQVALAAVADAAVVVVGPDRQVPPGVTVVREDPPGGGPAAAIAAGLATLPPLPDDALVVVLAADLPAIDRDAVHRLCASVIADGAVLVDEHGAAQWLAGAWRHRALVDAVRQRADWHGRSVRDLLGPLVRTELTGHERASADVDTPDDLLRLRSGWQRHGQPL